MHKGAYGMKWDKILKLLSFFIIVFGFIAIRGLSLSTDVSSSHPCVDAGDDFSVFSEDLYGTVIYGYANHTDRGHLVYRWREGDIELTSWQEVGPGGEVILDFSKNIFLAPGKHILTLEVNDGKNTAIDQMILTIDSASSIMKGESGVTSGTTVGLNPLN